MISTPITSDLIHGVAEVEPTPRGVALHRLPTWVRQQFPDPQLLAMEAQPSGVRLSFSTAASHIELVSHPNRVVYRGATRSRGMLDIFIDDIRHRRDELSEGDYVEVDLQTGESSAHAGSDHTTVLTELGTDTKRVEIWLPHNEAIELVELRTDSPIEAEHSIRARWVHHGSSISHGSNALAPSEIWPVVAARTAGNIELRNLGLGGSALVDPFLARVIRDTPADVISVKLGINVVNLDSMRLRSFVPAIHGFLDTIRDGHPDTPLVLVSPLFCGIHENTSGPCAIDPDTLGTDQVRFIATGTPGDSSLGRLTLEVIRDALRSVVAQRSHDQHLHYLDGLDLYGAADAETMPLLDGLHPSEEAHRLIGKRFAESIFAPGRYSNAGTR